MRGTPHHRTRPLLHDRFIPAHAGNSPFRRASSGSVTVHPRACGELIFRLLRPGRGTGSSPRMRGTQYRASRSSSFVRFIPAHAGNSVADVTSDGLYRYGSSPRMRGTRSQGPVHLRACGELDFPCRTCDTGSSPRMRGTQCVAFAVPQSRFIPAHAGNSDLVDPCTARPTTVHPRACGELALSAPAHAVSRSINDAVHPRACGELACSIRLPANPGSSPRMRGTQQGAADGHRRSTVHPRACGELSPVRPVYPKPVHPRACGELADLDGRKRRVTVHPRACGELGQQDPVSPHSRRFIPAHAGNSVKLDKDGGR